ncbi:MAG: T9SS type A sorting domain-containing protein [Bacteroidetes bacterium]|nr:T9SS type A sorting domain-containing protein [Bacteroidota bacterium]MBS1929660.1 T9SS type A sorting domain-containing protein [Bacteroidota bacterium]
MKNLLPFYLLRHFRISAEDSKEDFNQVLKKAGIRFVFILIILFTFKQNFAQTYFRSKGSGNWNNTLIWESSANAINWVNASVTPTDINANSITIQNGHIVTITADVTVDEVVIATGGEIDLGNGVNLTITNGSGTDFDVNGIFRNGTGTANGAGGTVTQNAGSTMVFENGSTYQHGFTNTSGNIPVAAWNTGSTCEIVGYTSFAGNVGTGFDQNFFNFTWDCTNQTGSNGINLGGKLTTINGDFNIINTGSGNVQLGNNSNFTTTIAGNYNQTGGTLYIVKTSQTGNVNLSGDFNMSGGVLRRGGGTNRFYFTGTGTQKMIKTGGTITGAVRFYINSGATVDFGNYVLDGSGALFTAYSGATIITANAGGFDKNSSSGSVQVSGSRTFSGGVNYIYNGNQNQITGDGLTQNTPANVTISNTGSSGNNTVSLTSNTTISGDLLISSGIFGAGGSNRDFTLSGNWINNGGSYEGGTSTVTFSGSNQVIGGTAGTSFPNLQIDRGASVTLDKSATATSLTFVVANAATNFSQNAGDDLTVSGDVNIMQPNANNITTAWNINEGTATVNGNIIIGGTNNNTTRIAKLVTTTGSLTVSGDIIYNSSNSNPASAVIDMSGGAGIINLSGGLLTNHNSGTLNAGSSSIFNFNGTSPQLIPLGMSNIIFNNIYTNNTSPGGAILNGAVTATNVTGDIRVKSGLLNNGANPIVGNSLKTFEISEGATFRLTGMSASPTGFLNQVFSTNSTTEFAGTNQSINPAIYGILITSGTGTKTLSGNITVKGDITINSGSSLDVSPGNFGITAQGDWINNGSFISQNGTIFFNGTDPQNIGGSSASTFNNLSINNSSGVTLQQNESVKAVLTFSNGLIYTSGSALLTLDAGSAISGATDKKFVNGPMKKIGNTAFTFPVGKSSVYAPVSISAPSNSTDAFIAEYMRANAKALGPVSATGLELVSACEYWRVERVNGTSNVDVTLSWSGLSPCNTATYVTDPRYLVVAHFNGASWNAYGNDGGYTGNVSNGTVTWKNVSSFSPFTLGSNSPGVNPLPVKFGYARATVKSSHLVQIDWKVFTENNIKYYEIERSNDGQNFETIGQMLPTGNNSSEARYTWDDKNYDNTVALYRVKSVDINNEFLYSSIMRIDPTQTGASQLIVFPNPVVGNQFSIQLSNIISGKYSIQIFDINGRNMYNQIFEHPGGTWSQSIQLPAGIKSGIYSMRISGSNLNLLKSFIVN